MNKVEVYIEVGEDKCFQYYNVGTQEGNNYETGTIEITLPTLQPSDMSITIGVWKSLDPKPYQRVMIIGGSWTLEGKLISVVHISSQETHYHCRNTLFPFVISVKAINEKTS